jgi:hypothetical protein
MRSRLLNLPLSTHGELYGKPKPTQVDLSHAARPEFPNFESGVNHHQNSSHWMGLTDVIEFSPIQFNRPSPWNYDNER